MNNLVLHEVTESNVQTLCNLWTLFRYDLMPFIKFADGSHLNLFGTFGTETNQTHADDSAKAKIWCRKPGVLFAFLLEFEGHPAGFATVATPPHASQLVNYRLNDLFIISKYRRSGLGIETLRNIFNRFPGKWEVSWVRENSIAASFWLKAISKLTNGDYEETTESVEAGFENSPRLLFHISRPDIE
jgi:aminoglycoside 6'-N-acetyltransferase I